MHKPPELLIKELEEAAKVVKVGGIYYHYKNANQYYKVLKLAIMEVDDTICVIYEAQYDNRLIFVRPLYSWLDKVMWDGDTTDRFTLSK